MIQVANGTVNVGKSIIKTHQWLINSTPVLSWIKAKVLNSGIKTSVSGMRYAKNTPVASVADPQNFIRASANAARTLITMVTDTTHRDTTAEFLKKIRYVF